MSERATTSDELNYIHILGVPVHAVTMKQVLGLVDVYMGEPKLHQIATVNPEFIMTAQDNTAFLQLLNEVDLCIPDGVGLLLAARWLGQPLPERVAGSDLVYRLAELASKKDWSLFLLGAGPGVAEEAGLLLTKLYPGLIVAGTFGGTPDLAENEAIVKRVNDSKADILYVAYGAPKQDLWISRNRMALQSVRLALGIGGSLDFITGRAVRAPGWIQRTGLEWLHRLYKEPWRWRRMTSLPKFAYRVVRERVHR